jgi:hypothetical protein
MKRPLNLCLLMVVLMILIALYLLLHRRTVNVIVIK